MHRKSSLRVELGDLKIFKKREKSVTGRLRGRYLFRAAVRLVIEYMDWITGESMLDAIGDDVAANVRIAQRRSTQEKKGLTMEDRTALLTKPHERSKDDKIHIINLIKTLRAFRKYPDNLKQSVAAVCRYQCLGTGRVIVRQGHPAHALYYIVKGDVTLTKIVTDHVTGRRILTPRNDLGNYIVNVNVIFCYQRSVRRAEILQRFDNCDKSLRGAGDVKEVSIGTMGPGDMFGEIALLHSIPRTTTVTSKTPIDLFIVVKSDFDRILKNILLQDWNILQDALIKFNYFKAWDENTIRECCILSKIKNYEPNEVLLGDGKGMVNYVYFVLAGECRLIEHMIIHEEKTFGKVKYSLHKSRRSQQASISHIRRAGHRVGPETKTRSSIRMGDSKFDEEDESKTRPSIQVGDSESDEEDDHPVQSMLSARPPGNIDTERMSIVTTTLQDVVNQWHEITEVAAMLMREPSVTSQSCYPPGVHTIFMQVCKFYRGGCFGLGEEMRDRRIVSISPVRCLLVPRYWLLEHNRANIWERVKLFMESKYPSRDELFKHFVTNRRWMRFKRELVSEIITNGKKYPNDTSVHDVPYSIRINEEVDGA